MHVDIPLEFAYAHNPPTIARALTQISYGTMDMWAASGDVYMTDYVYIIDCGKHATADAS